MRESVNHRPCERLCPRCGQWLHYSRFRHRAQSTHRSVCTKFNRLCRACEQVERNEKKNDDRPLAIIETRARGYAGRLGVAFDFVWVNLNWRSLVPVYRALSGTEGLCQSCGHRFDHERDIQIEHVAPPRRADDWARHHARNLRFLCGSCNRGKTNKPHDRWLDDEEHARVSNDAHRRARVAPDRTGRPTQLRLEFA